MTRKVSQEALAAALSTAFVKLMEHARDGASYADEEIARREAGILAAIITNGRMPCTLCGERFPVESEVVCDVCAGRRFQY